MEKEFIPYELAVKLKELGFDEPCLAYYNESNSNHDLETTDWWCLPQNDFQYALSAPTFSQAFRWFRGKYDYCSYVKEATKGTYRFYIEKFDEKSFYSARIETYEEAELACLDKLIELTFKSE